MKVLGIMGSPRIGGNTQILLDVALKEACSAGATAETLLVDRLKISPCREYYGCLKDGNCVIRDDMDAIYPQLISADIVIVAAPMFFYGLTSQVKALIDHCSPSKDTASADCAAAIHSGAEAIGPTTVVAGAAPAFEVNRYMPVTMNALAADSGILAIETSRRLRFFFTALARGLPITDSLGHCCTCLLTFSRICQMPARHLPS